GLVDADVRFDAAEKNLPRARLFELREKFACTTRTERGLFNRLKAGGQRGVNLCGRAPQALRVLFGDDDGYIEQLRALRDARDACSRLSEICDDVAKTFLHVYDDERSL